MRIIKIVFFVFLINIAAYAQPAGSIVSQPAGIVLSVSGDVQLESAGMGGDSYPATVKAIIYQDDVIITGDNGRVQVLFRDDTIMSLSPDTELALTDFDFSGTGNSFAANIAKGVARVVTGEIVKRNPENFNISTPHATIAIRGTTVTAIVQPAGTSTIINDATLGRPVVVTSIATNEVVSSDLTGMALHADAGGAASVREATADELRVSQQVSPSLPIDSETVATESRNDLGGRTINAVDNAIKEANDNGVLPPELTPVTVEAAVYTGSLDRVSGVSGSAGSFSFHVNMSSGQVTSFEADIRQHNGPDHLEIRHDGGMVIQADGSFSSSDDLRFTGDPNQRGSYWSANEASSILTGKIGSNPSLNLDIQRNDGSSLVNMDGKNINCSGVCN
ncbi:MAG: FecR family protein [Deferribacteraceae bacterium]|nr:FecR family protein [Deferribacteraceae bacterium]